MPAGLSLGTNDDLTELGLLTKFCLYFCSRASPLNGKDLWFFYPFTEGVCKVLDLLPVVPVL